jgi:hypothetical protein
MITRPANPSGMVQINLSTWFVQMDWWQPDMSS